MQSVKGQGSKERSSGKSGRSVQENVNQGKGKKINKRTFLSEKGMRQRCLTNQILFNITMVDLKESLEEEGQRGARIDREKLHMFGYADDIVIVVKEEKGMKMIMKVLQ